MSALAVYSDELAVAAECGLDCRPCGWFDFRFVNRCFLFSVGSAYSGWRSASPVEQGSYALNGSAVFQESGDGAEQVAQQLAWRYCLVCVMHTPAKASTN